MRGTQKANSCGFIQNRGLHSVVLEKIICIVNNLKELLIDTGGGPVLGTLFELLY